MPKLEAITYIDGVGNPQTIEPKPMSLLERARTGILLCALGLLNNIIYYENPEQVETINTKLWLQKYYPREGVTRLLNFMKAYAPLVRSTRQIQIERTLAGRSCSNPSWDVMFGRKEPRFTIQSITTRAVFGSLFPRYITTEPITP